MAVNPNQDTAKRDELARWAEEQRRTHKPRASVRFKSWLSPGERFYRGSLVVDRFLDRLVNRVLGRGFDTATYAVTSEHQHPDRTHYVPSAWHMLPRALRYVGVSENDTFVDFGCGKGRVVHQAARRPFRRVIGVEISPELVEIARAGLEANRHKYRCRDVEVVAADVTEYEVPDDLTIAYLYRPFEGEFLDAVLEGIVDSMDRNPRHVWLIYIWPSSRGRAKVDGTGRFRLVKQQSSSLINPRSYPVAFYESC